MCRAFAPILARPVGGAIVNVLSMLGRVASPRLGGYSTSKAAALSLTQSIRAQLPPRGTLVTGALPGFIDTDMARRVTAPKLSLARVASSIVEALRAELKTCIRAARRTLSGRNGTIRKRLSGSSRPCKRD